MSFFEDAFDLLDCLIDRFRYDNEVNRREDRDLEESANDITDPTGPTRIVSVDFKPKDNAANHHCEKYELVTRQKGTPIVRRGGTFTFTVDFNHEVDLKKKDLLKVYLSYGSAPNVQKGTQAVLQVSGKRMIDKNHEEWDIRVVQQEGTQVTLEVQVPTDAPVGAWMPTLEVSPREGPRSERHLRRHDTIIYILFNPWNKHDTVYLPEEERRQEYVLNDVGKIWTGEYPTARGRHWVFGQFDDAVLPACIILLERSGLRPEGRGDPVRVSRAISKIVNSKYDNGVLVGKWRGSYTDGTAPSVWTGSIKILEEYVRTNQSVRYGQCWVFAGVVNTVCRALGLPSRVVTNLTSAHDTNFSLTIDEYFDEEGNKIGYSYFGNNPGGLRDSIWNFHVWNDVWMARPDLPQGYGGWQVIDATPQELSDGSAQCGPASHEAIRQGQLDYKYDVPFVLAEVNADVVYWQRDEKEQDGYKKLNSNKYEVGRQLLTKKLGPVEDSGFFEKDKDDVTSDYKAEEGSRAERLSLLTAARRTRAARHAFRLPSVAEEDVEISIVDVKRVPIGQDFTMVVKLTNTSNDVRTVQASLSAYSIYYTGAKAEHIMKGDGSYILQPHASTSSTLDVKYSDYYEKLVEHAMIKMVALCHVPETGYSWAGDARFEVLKPDIVVQPLSDAVVGRPIQVKFSFTNPMPTTLRECVLVVDGPGLLRPKTIPINNVSPNGKMEYELRLIPRKEATVTIVATFNSKDLLNLTGSSTINVAAANA